MKKLLFVASVKNFIPAKGSDASLTDTNGARNKSLIALHGSAPRNVNVVSGTVAENMEVQNNKLYLFAATRGEDYEGQPSYNFDVQSEINPIEFMGMTHKLEVMEETTTTTAKDNGVLTPKN